MQPEVNQELAQEFGLSASEYAKVLEIMGRTPTLAELGMFSAMWSEHCSYKSSRVLLKQLPTKAPWVIHGPGENAGVVDIGHGHVRVNGRKVNIPSYRVRESDIVEIADKSRELTPFVVARAEAGERTVPAWLGVVPDKMRVLVHSLPSRAQIDTLVQEQLIVEYYSKQ